MENKRELKFDLSLVKDISPEMRMQKDDWWPEAILRALIAEKKNEIFLKWLNDDNCPFKAIEGKDLCDGSCPGCVTENIDFLALAELGLKEVNHET